MKILANRKIKLLFYLVLLFIIVFTLISVVFIGFKLENAALYILLFSLCTDIFILAIGYWYFKEQNKIMENATTQIREYISGNQDARIECNDEGELYRLFHEVNSLVSILSSNAKNKEKSKKFLKDTISDISHQLKTPLTNLNIYNGIMQDEVNDLPVIKEFTYLSEQELDRIEILVQNLLKITKFDAGTIVIEKSIENISEMMGYIQRHFTYRNEQEGKILNFSGDDTITLLCDRNWLIEAISNIVKNAFDHTKKGNTICIEWKQFASIIQITIKDNGSGIHIEDLHHIFKRFYRSRFSKDTQGIGLGLPLAKLIIESHSGTIEVDSELGIGTTFTINFLIPTEL
ncbi:sensor histidine kinase [Romboutsia lituseburensis]|uniref:sensor histidine kinase n=1 Tax=Romboutsia lituseburensis TaxID=1537 RepID=UPI00215B6C73|nr:HAMP domain-containing histidine kinase [Romboutsia lituseburensis]MCR8747185.1 HAMP domain-containing histidine kinase [Romboutsia lituseburensis]